MSKITDYPIKPAFNDGDLYDVSSFDGVSTYTSEKMTFAQLKAELNSALGFVNNNLYEGDGTLTDPRTVNQNSHYINFTDGNFGIGIIPATNFHVGNSARIDENLTIGDNQTPSATILQLKSYLVPDLLNIQNNGGSDNFVNTNSTLYWGVGTTGRALTPLTVKGIDTSSSRSSLACRDGSDALVFYVLNNGQTTALGTLAVGLAAASETLHVNGNARVDGLIKANDNIEIASAKDLKFLGTGNSFIRFGGLARFVSAGTSGTGFETAIMPPATNEGVKFYNAAGSVVHAYFQDTGNDGRVALGNNFLTPSALLHMKPADPINSLHIESSGDANTLVVSNLVGLTNGNVGIGTTPSTDKLHVNGNVRADGDYVVNGNTGFTGTGAYTNFTIEGGIITAAS